MNEEKLLEVLTDIRNWTRAASFNSVKALLQTALPDTKARLAYQMLDGNASLDQTRIGCKLSPNLMGAIAQRCIAMGLMELSADNRRRRLFDLNDFNLLDPVVDEQKQGDAIVKAKHSGKR